MKSNHAISFVKFSNSHACSERSTYNYNTPLKRLCCANGSINKFALQRQPLLNNAAQNACRPRNKDSPQRLYELSEPACKRTGTYKIPSCSVNTSSLCMLQRLSPRGICVVLLEPNASCQQRFKILQKVISYRSAFHFLAKLCIFQAF